MNFKPIGHESLAKLIDNFRMTRRVSVNCRYVYIGIVNNVNVISGRDVSFIFVDNCSNVVMDMFSVRIVCKVGYKSKVKLVVNSIVNALTIIVGPKSKLLITTNGILQSFNLHLNIKLMSYSKAEVSANMIIALNYAKFATNVLALEQFATIKLVYNVIILKQSSLNLRPSFELRGKTARCIHSIFVKTPADDGGYISNRLISSEVINALTAYTKCIT
ncbi:MAG: hypothetical protein ACTS5A_00335 [Candidatus Hodgkinia cicadicola]